MAALRIRSYKSEGLFAVKSEHLGERDSMETRKNFQGTVEN